MLPDTDCILYPDQCAFLCKIAFFSLITSLYAIYKDKYDLAIVVFGVFLTSIIYWYKPTLCWRQTLDVIYVKFALFYHMIRGFNSEYYFLYYITLFISLCFYPLGIYLYNKKLYWESTYAHSMVHIISNISNIILYSGSIVPIAKYFDYLNNPLTILPIESISVPTCSSNSINSINSINSNNIIIT